MGGSIVLISVQIGENLVRVIINDTGLIILILINNDTGPKYASI